MKNLQTYTTENSNHSQSVSIVKGEKSKRATEYNFAANCTRIGATGRTANVIRRAEQLKSIEEKFLSFAYRVGKTETQREARRAQRAANR